MKAKPLTDMIRSLDPRVGGSVKLGKHLRVWAAKPLTRAATGRKRKTRVGGKFWL